MIGLTTSLAAVEGFEQPAGFAIPVDEAFRKTVDTLKQGRQPAFGFLGVQPDHLTSAQRRDGQFLARVLRVVPGTPADRAGIKQDDIITHVNEVEVADKNILFRELSKVPAESKVELKIQRRDPLRSRRRPTTVAVTLAKKYIDSDRRPFAQVAPPAWRGVRVEYPSALPPEYNIQPPVVGDQRGYVAVLDVDRDSSAWKAGLRRGDFVSHVDNTPVTTPREFFTAVEDLSGDVRLHLIGQPGGDHTLVITP
jgi:serine protease Do